MSNWYEPTDTQRAAFASWVKDRPASIRAMVEAHPPWKMYRLNDTGHRVFLYSYNEDGTMTVIVSKEFNMLGFERRVFGIPPSNLTECDLPEPGEPVGCSNLNIEDVRAIFKKQATFAERVVEKVVDVWPFDHKKALENLGKDDDP